jgi:hypothetical protein
MNRTFTYKMHEINVHFTRSRGRFNFVVAYGPNREARELDDIERGIDRLRGKSMQYQAADGYDLNQRLLMLPRSPRRDALRVRILVEALKVHPERAQATVAKD